MTLSNFRTIFNNSLAPLFPKTEIDAFFFRLIEHQLNYQLIDAFTKQESIISDDDKSAMNSVLERLMQQEPIQYILGSTNFYGLNLKVTPATLIPRPETEELVSWVLQEIKKEPFANLKKIHILDIGTGSGCISISLKKEYKEANLSAIDISKEALHIASENAKKHETKINFYNIDILNTRSLPQNFDIIISNPPYVRVQEKIAMKKNVLDFEPNNALFVSDENPLLFYKRIADLANQYLNKNGVLFFEINQYLGDETQTMLQQKGFKNVELKNDLFGNPRMIKAYINQ